MNTQISTDHLPAPDRVDFVREALFQARMTPLEFVLDTEEGFRFEVRYRDLGAVRVSVTSASPHQVRRTPALIRESDHDRLSVGVGLRGFCVVEQYDRQSRVPSFDLCLWDSRAPYGASIGVPAEYLVMHFPRALLPLPDAHLKQLVAVNLQGGQGVGALTSQLLVQLAAGDGPLQSRRGCEAVHRGAGRAGHPACPRVGR